MKASPGVFIYNSIEEAQIAAVAGATTVDELPPMVFLPSNGFEVDPSKFGSPPTDEDEGEDPDPDHDPGRERVTRARLEAPPVAPRPSPSEDEDLTELTEADAHGLKASRSGSKTAETKPCTCNGTGDGFVTCAVHGRFR